MKHFLLRNLELVFTLAGLGVILAATLLIHPGDASPWAVAAVTAILVGVIHGLLFWAVRHRQRVVRHQTLIDTRHMLRDIVMNQLAVVRLQTELQKDNGSKPAVDALQRLESAITIIDSALKNLDEESLSRWRNRYGITAPPADT